MHKSSYLGRCKTEDTYGNAENQGFLEAYEGRVDC